MTGYIRGVIPAEAGISVHLKWAGALPRKRINNYFSSRTATASSSILLPPVKATCTQDRIGQ